MVRFYVARRGAVAARKSREKLAPAVEKAIVLGRAKAMAKAMAATSSRIPMQRLIPAASPSAPLAPGDLKRAEETSTPTEVLPPEIPNPTASISITTIESLALAPTTSPTTSTTVSSQNIGQTQTSAAHSTATAGTDAEGGDGEMNVAVKAGIAIGALGGVLVVFVLVWLLFSMRRKKLERQRQQIEADEKIHGPFTDAAAIRSPTTAPRLSLRPITQFFPALNTTNQAERSANRSIPLTLNPVSASPTASLSPLKPPTGGSAWERPTLNSTLNAPSPHGDRPGTSTSSLYPNDPFNDTQRVHNNEPVSPISSMGSFKNRPRAPTATDAHSEPVSPIEDDETDTAATLTRKASMRKDLPKPLDLTKPPSPLYVPPSPAATEYSMHSMAPGQAPGPSASAAAIAAAGGPSHSTVHRVQLDFKPMLEDELEVKAGQLVRLLHQYDDGWALCIRLDRSEQGVVPRTCLSTRPVKPRPAHTGAAGSGSSFRFGPPVNPSYQHHRQQSSSASSGRFFRPHSPGGPLGPGMNSGNNAVSPPPGGNGPRYRPGQGMPPSHNTGGGRRAVPAPPAPAPGQVQGQGHGQGQGQGQYRGYGHGYGDSDGYDSEYDNHPSQGMPGQAY